MGTPCRARGPYRSPGLGRRICSVLIEHNYRLDGKKQKKLVEVAVGFGNAKGRLSFPLPQGTQVTDQARIVIFPITPKKAR